MFVLAKIFAWIVGRDLSRKNALNGQRTATALTVVATLSCTTFLLFEIWTEHTKKGKDTDFCCGFGAFFVFSGMDV